MTEPTKEQVWKEEARKAYQDQQSQDNEGGCREPIGFVQGYIAAKKSDFEEIKTLKEQLAKAESVIKFYSEGYVVDQAEWDDDDDAEWINTWSLYTGKRARQYLNDKQGE